MFVQAVAVDSTCDLQMYLELVINKNISSWDAWYAHIIHYFWTLVLYFYYFIYGVIWTNHYDMGYGVGMITQTLF